MKRPAGDGAELPAKKPRLLPAIGQVAEEDHHVFISLEGYAEKVGKLFEGGHSVVFIRSGVATGKTTLAEELARQSPQYVNVPFTGGGKQSSWEMRTVEAIEKSTDKRINRDELAFGNALKVAADRNLILVYDEAHTLFASRTAMLSPLQEQWSTIDQRVLLFSASERRFQCIKALIVSTPGEITQKYMWTPPLSYTKELETQLKEAGVRLDQKSIEFCIRFCGGHRGIFIAAMHWVQSKQTSGESWDFKKTVGSVRNSYGTGDWNCADNEILGHLRESRAVRVNGFYKDVNTVPREFAELLCKGSTTLPQQQVRRDLTIYGFVLPKHNGDVGELQKLDWMNAMTEYRVANPLLALYYRFQLKKSCGLELQFEQSEPQGCADLLMRALPYMLFSKVVSFEGGESELATDGLPHEQQYNKAVHSVLQDMGYMTFAPEASEKGKGKPDLAVKIGAKTFIIEGAKSKIPEHLERFRNFENYKSASHKGLYIIGNDSKTILTTMTTHAEGDVQVIGLVPNIAHTAYTVHVKSKGIEPINTFRVDCDLVARRLVLKDDGEPELYSVQSLKSVNLSPKAQSRRWVRSLVGWFFFCLSPFSASVFRK